MIGHNRASFDAVVEENLLRGVYLVHLQALQRCIKDPRLDQRHRLVLVALSECTNSKSGMAYPGRSWLAKSITYYQHGEPRQYSEGTIANTLSELVDFEYLSVSRRAPVGGGQALSHYYAITSPANEELLAKIAEACAIIKANPKRPFPGSEFNTGVDVKTRVDVRAEVTAGDDVSAAKPQQIGPAASSDVKSGVDVNTGDDIRPPDVNFFAAEVNSRRGQELVIGTGSKISAAKDAAPKTIASTSRGSRLTAEWILPDDWRAWTHAHFRVSPHKVQIEADNFRDYWVAKPGPGAAKLDWAATWCSWCRRGFEKFAVPADSLQARATPDREREAYDAQLLAAGSIDP